MKPHWYYANGYELRKERGQRLWWWPIARTTIYRVTMDGAKPLTWVDANGDAWRGKRDESSDKVKLSKAGFHRWNRPHIGGLSVCADNDVRKIIKIFKWICFGFFTIEIETSAPKKAADNRPTCEGISRRYGLPRLHRGIFLPSQDERVPLAWFRMALVSFLSFAGCTVAHVSDGRASYWRCSLGGNFLSRAIVGVTRPAGWKFEVPSHAGVQP